MRTFLLLVLACLATPALSFVANGFSPALRTRATSSGRACGLGLRMAMEQIEYIIHRDGRVEEKVTGIKGKECHQVTEEVEKALGKVVYTAPTAEQFEEKISISQQDIAKDSVQKWGQY